jgi:hypothetical protein
LKSANPQFLDEFKIKLPLILGGSGGVIVLFFSVYQVHVQQRRGLIQAISRNHSEADNVLEHLGSGVLPLSSDENPCCLLSNGDHKVQINYRILDSVSTAKHHRPKTSTSSIGSSVVKHLKSLSWTNDEVARSFSIDTMSMDGDDSLSANQQELAFESSYPPGTVFLERMDGTTADSLDIPDRQSVKSDTGSTTDHRSVKSDAGRTDNSPFLSGMKTSLSSGNLQQLTSANEVDLSEETPSDAPNKDELILKVNVIAISSVHPQNKVLADFFMLKPDRPRCVVSGDFSALSPWGKHRSEILYRLKPERIPPFNFVGGALAESERVSSLLLKKSLLSSFCRADLLFQKLLEPVVNLAKSAKCPANDAIPHLLRIITQLLRTMTCGIGEPSILWASPESLIPLRLNAFASLLHVISSASHYMAKTGLRLLDRDTKWNISGIYTFCSFILFCTTKGSCFCLSLSYSS